jgi:hypothetical protein
MKLAKLVLPGLFFQQSHAACDEADYSSKTVSVEVSTYKSWTFSSFETEIDGSCDTDFTYSATMKDGSDLDYFITLDSDSRKFEF